MDLIERLDRQLSLCEPGCNGRCKECPDDVIRDAKAALTRLRSEVEGARKLPSEATDEMVEAAYKKYSSDELQRSDDWLRDVLNAALFAADHSLVQQNFVDPFQRQDS